MMVIEAVAPPANNCNNSDDDTDRPLPVPLALALAALAPLALAPAVALVPAVPPPLAGAGPGFCALALASVLMLAGMSRAAAIISWINKKERGERGRKVDVDRGCNKRLSIGCEMATSRGY